MTGVPDTLEEALSPGWLSHALGIRFPGVKVTSSELGPVVSRVSTNARFRIECEGEVPDGLPTDLCVKGYFTDYGEDAAQSRAAGEPEALFYREFADSLGIRTLRVVYADVDRSTHHGVVITEDVAATGATFLDARSDYSPDQVAESLEQLAILHGRTWESDRLGDRWLSPRVERTLQARGLPVIRDNFGGPVARLVPDTVRDAERLVATVELLPALLSEARPRCLLHGDAHVGNLYLDGDGHSCMLDWQLVQRGPWYLDVGYHLGCTMSVTDRRRTERELLAHYLDCLGASGGDAPESGEAWHSLAIGIVYGFFLWSITLKMPPDVTALMLERLGSAVEDHDALSSVEGATP